MTEVLKQSSAERDMTEQAGRTAGLLTSTLNGLSQKFVEVQWFAKSLLMTQERHKGVSVSLLLLKPLISTSNGRARTGSCVLQSHLVAVFLK